jgi:hypothetical protein
MGWEKEPRWDSGSWAGSVVEAALVVPGEWA